MNWSISQSTPPTIEPVTLAELRAHCRVDTTDDDTVLTNLGKAARAMAENITRRQFIDASYTLVLPDWPDVIELPRPPLDSVTTLKYYNTGGTLTTLTAVTDYAVDAAGIVGQVRPAYSKSWPALRDVWNAVEVIYKAGYGAATTDVPEPIRLAILLMAGHWYEHREAAVIGAAVTELPMAVEALLSPYRVWLENPESES